MIILLTLISSVTSIIGNVTAKYWADTDRPLWMIITLVTFIVSTISYVYTLRFGGHYTIVNALFYAIVPIATVLTGIFFFHDRLTTLQGVGLVLGLIAILLFVVEGKLEVPK